MANKKLTDLTELTTPADNDFFYIVDVSDTTESPQGTSKKIRKDKVDSGASKENIANKQNDLTPDGTGTKYPTVDAVNNALPTSYSKIVYVNTTSPTTATIFDLNNPPVTNDNLLKNDTANLYIGTDASTWVYLTGSGYVTKTVPSTSNFNTFGTTVDAGNSKTSHITRSGPVTLTGSLNLAVAKISTTPNTSAGSYDILTRNSSTTALEKKLVSDFVQTTGNQSISGNKTFTGVMSAKTIFVSSQNSGYSIYLDNTFGGNGLDGRNYSGGNFIYATPGSGNGFYFDLLSETTGVGGKFNSSTTATGNLLEFQKNGTITTSINHLGEIVTMTPTASGQVAIKGYVDGKITQTITNGVTDKSPSEDAVYDALANVKRNLIYSTTTSTPITGTITETVLYSQLIPANTFKNGGFFNIDIARLGKIGVEGTLRNSIRINTTNTLSGSILIADNMSTASNTNVPLSRKFSIEGGFLKGFGNGQVATDMINSSLDITSYAFNPTIDNYIFICGTMSVATTSMFFSSLQITN